MRGQLTKNLPTHAEYIGSSIIETSYCCSILYFDPKIRTSEAWFNFISHFIFGRHKLVIHMLHGVDYTKVLVETLSWSLVGVVCQFK